MTKGANEHISYRYIRYMYDNSKIKNKPSTSKENETRKKSRKTL